ncbi:MAG: hydroxymethylbilane synthase [Gemmatimonadetes bacterium]|nr:hydroxymethylbilane synthase [Gemmatimonadota bacterium]
MARVDLRLGTRGSLLALTQSQWVADRLAGEGGLRVHLRRIRTTGDIVGDRPLAEFGGKGLFTKELDHALLAGEVDLAVHSMKDLPAELPEGLSIGAVPEREDPRDVLIGALGREVSLQTLPEGARVGTGSLRRVALLRALRPDLEVVALRGNVDTRIEKVDEGELDAVVLAAAGIRRLGWGERIGEYLDPGSWVPAPGQGALAVVVRSDDREVARSLAGLDHAPSRAQTEAERELLRGLGADCRMPVAALGLSFGGGLRLRALVASPDGRRLVRGEGTGNASDPRELGRRVAELLLERGADVVLERGPGIEGWERE